ncbi:serine hydrolase domain-containing protein [Enterococcus sp. LJL99]
MPHRRKHRKKSRKFLPFLIIIFLILLLAAECYLIIDNPKKIFDFTTKKTTETIETTKEKTIVEQPKKEKILTTSADQIDNFNQEVLPTSDLSTQIDQDLQNGNFIGTALVVHEGIIILQKGYGYSNAQNETLNTYHSIYQIGSIQKGMTATLIAQQIQAGKLSLEDTLDKFYPNVPLSNQITIQQLLSMTSGLKHGEKPTIDMSDDAFLSFAISNSSMGTYGKYNYDAINYYLLVGILEKITGEKYRTLFNNTYIKPLSLSHTMFYNDFISAPNRTYTYAANDKVNYATTIPDAPLTFKQEVGTGSVGMTVGDLYWYYSSWLNGKLLTSDTFNSVWSPNGDGSYMGGIYNFPDSFKGHGVEDGFETVVYMSKDCQNAVILFTNQYPKNSTYQTLGTNLFQLITES